MKEEEKPEFTAFHELCLFVSFFLSFLLNVRTKTEGNSLDLKKKKEEKKAGSHWTTTYSFVHLKSISSPRFLRQTHHP